MSKLLSAWDVVIEVSGGGVVLYRLRVEVLLSLQALSEEMEAV